METWTRAKSLCHARRSGSTLGSAARHAGRLRGSPSEGAGSVEGAASARPYTHTRSSRRCDEERARRADPGGTLRERHFLTGLRRYGRLVPPVSAHLGHANQGESALALPGVILRNVPRRTAPVASIEDKVRDQM
jgi:hypothetical protein